VEVDVEVEVIVLEEDAEGAEPGEACTDAIKGCITEVGAHEMRSHSTLWDESAGKSARAELTSQGEVDAVRIMSILDDNEQGKEHPLLIWDQRQEQGWGWSDGESTPKSETFEGGGGGAVAERLAECASRLDSGKEEREKSEEEEQVRRRSLVKENIGEVSGLQEEALQELTVHVDVALQDSSSMTIAVPASSASQDVVSCRAHDKVTTMCVAPSVDVPVGANDETCSGPQSAASSHCGRSSTPSLCVLRPTVPPPRRAARSFPRRVASLGRSTQGDRSPLTREALMLASPMGSRAKSARPWLHGAADALFPELLSSSVFRRVTPAPLT